MKTSRYFLPILFFFLSINLNGQAADGLLFHLSGENVSVADYAHGSNEAYVCNGVRSVSGGVRGNALEFDYHRALVFPAAGNIYPERGAISFYWSFASSELSGVSIPLLKVSYADHNSYEKRWLGIDWTGKGYSVSLTENNTDVITLEAECNAPKGDTWQEFLLSWDCRNGISLFVDGCELARHTGAFASDLALGEIVGEALCGKIDELKIYDHDVYSAASSSEYMPASISGMPFLESSYTSVRRVAVSNAYEKQMWSLKACDGLAGTSVSTDSLVVYTSSAAWNNIQILGNVDAQSGVDIARDATGSRISFKAGDGNMQVQELNLFELGQTEAPEGLYRMSYSLAPFTAGSCAALAAVEKGVNERCLPESRTMALAVPSAAEHAALASDGNKVLHIAVPSNTREVNPRYASHCSWNYIQAGLDGIELSLPAFSGAEPVQMRICVKDPVCERRNIFDFAFSVPAGEEKTLWLDMRDMILPDTEPLLITLEGAPADELALMSFSLVFKDRDLCIKEHVEDRFAMVRDCYSSLYSDSLIPEHTEKYLQIENDINDLLRVDPSNVVARQYRQVYYPEQKTLGYVEPVAPSDMPEWAFLQLSIIKELHEIYSWYAQYRGDLTNAYPSFYEAGLSHTLYTPQPFITQDDPVLVESVMAEAKAVKEQRMGVNDFGHLHFRSQYGWSSDSDNRTLAAAIFLGEVYGNRDARSYVTYYAKSLVADGVPAEVNFNTEDVFGESLNAQEVLYYAWKWSGDNRYLPYIEDGPYMKADYSVERMVPVYRSLLRTIHDRRYIVREGYPRVERLGIPFELATSSRVGGIVVGENDAFTSGNRFSWAFNDSAAAENVAILVEQCAQDSCRVLFYNAGKDVVQLTMLGRNIGSGKWSFQMGRKKTKCEFGRGRAVQFNLRHGASTLVMHRDDLSVDYSKRADLTASNGDVQVSNGEVTVRVHNIGSKASNATVVRLYDKNGKNIGQASLEPVPAPAGLLPSTATVKINFKPKKKPARIEIDPLDKVAEVFESNNTITL